MKVRLLVLVMIGLLGVSACEGGPGGPTPTPEPPTQVVSAGPGAAQIVTFPDQEGAAQLGGSRYGSGTTAIIVAPTANEGKVSWTVTAKALAAAGFTVLVCDYRGQGMANGSNFDAQKAPADLRAAAAYMRDQGATSIVFVGAALGGTLVAKAAAVEQPAAVVILSGSTSAQGVAVSDEELKALTAPKLFVDSENSPYVDQTIHMFDLSPEPKQKQIVSGSEFGHNLIVKNRTDLTQRIIEFIKANPPGG